jgi:hypothetical protein
MRGVTHRQSDHRKEKPVNEIVQLVAQKFNLSPETAQQVVDFVVAQVKGKLPANLTGHIDTILAGGEEAAGVFDKLKGLFHKA